MSARNLALFISTVLAVVVAGLPASAGTIAGNFAIGTNDNNSIDAGESAIVGTDATDTAILGADNLDGSKWNHLLLRNSTHGAPTIFTGNTQGGNSIALLDSDGNSAGTMTSAGGSFWSHWSNASDGAPPLGTTGESALMQSYLLLGSNGAETVTVTLPGDFADISVYAFFEIGSVGGGANEARTYGLDVNGVSAFWTDDNGGTADSDVDDDGLIEWKQTVGTTSVTATADGNYALFTGLSGTTVTFSGFGTEGRTVLSGFQIQYVPEPSTLVLALVGVIGMAFLGRRRRHRT